MQNIVNKLQSLYPISNAAIDLVKPHAVRCEFPKRHLLVSKGKCARSVFFIENGITRSYWVKDGEEFTTSFSSEGDVVFSMDEVYYGLPSEEYVETLEDAVVYRVPLDVLRTLVETHLEWANWWRVIHQNEYRRIHRTHKERLTLSAPERYEAFCRQFPDVCKRVNLGFVASYIGVTLSTLSRLRADACRF